MATGSRYFVAFRRRREGRTDYYQRTKLVVADAPRMVVRRTNRHIIVQMVIAEMDGDKTLVSANSAELEKYGYTGATANTPAAYLTGLLFAAKAKKAGQDRAILDIGLNRATPGARVFAALKGAVDAGLEIPYGEGIIPSEERIKGEHIAAHNKNASDIVKNVEQVADAIKKELV
ncbi:50S ribosomal protein L18 [Methanoregula sp.]|jgi:large subunit ribosomal protein L18|uniref:50S ribosomal protein L18 n=1 Tax=Methanoregula sp. TaxID=2052170 RepID=UPI003C234915